MNAFDFPPHGAFARLNLAALGRNFCLLRELARTTSPSARVIAVVKDNAYGHGLAAVLPSLCRVGCDFFAVSTGAEALQVRGFCPTANILVLGYTPPSEAPALAAADITQSVFSVPYAAALNDALSDCGQKLRIHIKIDGGLCRGGLPPEDETELTAVLGQKCLLPTGIYTHFPAADTDSAGTRRALTAFLKTRQLAKKAGFSLFSHAAASAATLRVPESRLDGIRAGIALYGLPPVRTVLPLSPVLSLHAPVICLRQVPAGTPVGYGGDFVTTRPSLIGTLPIGYGDGFCRALGTQPVTLCHEKQRFSVPVAGRICMDHTMVDLTDTPAAPGDRVCLWENAAAPAQALGTIPYEVLSALSPRVKRLAHPACTDCCPNC